MKAIELTSFGLDGLKLTERPIPEIDSGRVLVKMKAASLNYRDYLTAKGVYNRKYKLPLIPLSDGCGEIEAIGGGVTRVKTGDRVAPLFSQGWISGEATHSTSSISLGDDQNGCLQEYMVLPEDGVSKVPEHLSDVEVATLPCAALTAWSSLVVEGQIKPGDKVLLQGTGGVSIFGLQFAKMANAEVIITSSSDEKLEKAKALGAHHLINYKTHDKWYKNVLEITDGKGVDQVVEVGGAGTLLYSLLSLRMAGHISIVGVLSENTGDAPIVAMIQKQAKIKGIGVGNRDQFEDMCEAITIDKLKPEISHILPFEQSIEAFKLMEQGGHFGKICLKYE